jgi:hypothetical protein
MEAATKVQSMYEQRVKAGIDTGNQPEAAGILAVERMIHAYFNDLDAWLPDRWKLRHSGRGWQDRRWKA